MFVNLLTIFSNCKQFIFILIFNSGESLFKMKTVTRNIIFVLFFITTSSCEFYSNPVNNINKYNTVLVVTLSNTPAADAFFYNDKYDMVVTTNDPDTTIRYTTDGSDPTRTNGYVYTGPVNVTSANTNFTPGIVVLKVVSYDPNRISNIEFTTFELGDGSTTVPYKIATPLHLYNVSAKVNDGTYSGKSFLQIADIDLTPYSAAPGWVPIGTSSNPFTGTYNGGIYKITNLKINRTQDYLGFFGNVAGAGTLLNITIENVNITGYQYIGALAGNVDSITSGYIDHCVVGLPADTITGTNYVGGLVGYNGFSSKGAKITYCSSSINVSGWAGVGGLVGINSSALSYIFTRYIENCNSSGTVSGNSYIGGLVGYNTSSGKINLSYASGDVNGNISSSSYTGGLVGSNDYGAFITSSHATGTVTGHDNVGGLAGSNDNSSFITSSYATIGNVQGNNFNTGGLVGLNANGSTIDTCSATGMVTGVLYVGGLSGTNDNSTITKCISNSTFPVTGGSYTGGLVGYNSNNALIELSGATSQVICNFSYSGGLVGYNFSSSTIRLSCAKGSVSAGTSDAGGLVGNNDTGCHIINCYAMGDVNTSGGIGGGLVGSNNASTIDFSYSKGKVTAATPGGLIGTDTAGVTASLLLWDTGTSFQPTSAGSATGLITVDMKIQGNYSGWTFNTTTWAIDSGKNSGYPYLQWENL